MTKTKVDHPEFGHVTFTNLTQRQLDIIEGYKKMMKDRNEVIHALRDFSNVMNLDSQYVSEYIKENLV